MFLSHTDGEYTHAHRATACIRVLLAVVHGAGLTWPSEAKQEAMLPLRAQARRARRPVLRAVRSPSRHVVIRFLFCALSRCLSLAVPLRLVPCATRSEITPCPVSLAHTVTSTSVMASQTQIQQPIPNVPGPAPDVRPQQCGICGRLWPWVVFRPLPNGTRDVSAARR